MDYLRAEVPFKNYAPFRIDSDWMWPAGKSAAGCVARGRQDFTSRGFETFWMGERGRRRWIPRCEGSNRCVDAFVNGYT